MLFADPANMGLGSGLFAELTILGLQITSPPTFRTSFTPGGLTRGSIAIQQKWQLEEQSITWQEKKWGTTLQGNFQLFTFTDSLLE